MLLIQLWDGVTIDLDLSGTIPAYACCPGIALHTPSSQAKREDSFTGIHLFISTTKSQDILFPQNSTIIYLIGSMQCAWHRFLI